MTVSKQTRLGCGKPSQSHSQQASRHHIQTLYARKECQPVWPTQSPRLHNVVLDS